MTKEEILHLGTLSRIRIEESEVEGLAQDITNILDYVGVVQEVVGDKAIKKEVGSVYNVMRADEVTNEPGSLTEAILDEAPERDGRYFTVKKILDSKKK